MIMSLILYSVIICLLIVCVVLLIMIYKNCKCTCSTNNVSTFENLTLTKDEINTLWADTGCPNPLSDNILSVLVRSPTRLTKRMLTQYAKYYFMCGKMPVIKCPNADVITESEMNELYKMWMNNPLCKNRKFPKCYINQYYKGLTYQQIKEMFIEDIIDEMCPNLSN